ncbi:hypothetical protein UM396_14560 [Geobacillus subterraneus]|uniref:hypothetical protein n=1 Tax=Geobacillus subterraneus TaxID=129338 RepID=UPI002AC90AEB|nr:hypothetical protein [Geobacillus subterraneus]WPZ17804.1 hypothetical protein UM396_14560 [Geobacillus subterraneus]
MKVIRIHEERLQNKQLQEQINNLIAIGLKNMRVAVNEVVIKSEESPTRDDYYFTQIAGVPFELRKALNYELEKLYEAGASKEELAEKMHEIIKAYNERHS